MSRLVSIGEASEALGVSITTLRRWEAEGKLIPERTAAGHRRYNLEVLKPEFFHLPEDGTCTVAYSRTAQQAEILECYCSRQGWNFKVVSDFDPRTVHGKNIKQIARDIIEGSIGRLVLGCKDSLPGLSGELVLTICEIKQVEVVILNQGNDSNFEDCVVNDALDIINMLSIRLYSNCSRKSQIILKNLRTIIEDIER